MALTSNSSVSDRTSNTHIAVNHSHLIHSYDPSTLSLHCSRDHVCVPTTTAVQSLFSDIGDTIPSPLTLAFVIFTSDPNVATSSYASSSAVGGTSFTKILIGSLACPPPLHHHQ